jgi:hypothetical protein
MTFPKSKRNRLMVDGKPYIACVSQNGYTSDNGVKLRVIIQAGYGLESLCIIEGMVNRDYWLDFPDIDVAKTFSITPRTMCDLVRHALANGWAPVACKSIMRIQLDNEGLFEIMRRGNSLDPSNALADNASTQKPD